MWGIHRSQRLLTRSCDVFFDLRLVINGGVNNGEAGDLRRHQAHYDVIVMFFVSCWAHINGLLPGTHIAIT